MELTRCICIPIPWVSLTVSPHPAALPRLGFTWCVVALKAVLERAAAYNYTYTYTPTHDTCAIRIVEAPDGPTYSAAPASLSVSRAVCSVCYS